MTKPGRNDPCPCGSGEKFKKCCEKRMLKGRFLVTKANDVQKAGSPLSNLFQHNISQVSPFSLRNRTIVVKTDSPQPPKEEQSSENPPPESEKS